MQTIVETPEYLSAAKAAGFTDADREAVVTYVADNPSAGDIIPGSGGARKVRIAKQGGGKSGGFRVVTYFTNEDTPVFLLTVLNKTRRSNLTKGETNAIKRKKGR